MIILSVDRIPCKAQVNEGIPINGRPMGRADFQRLLNSNHMATSRCKRRVTTIKHTLCICSLDIKSVLTIRLGLLLVHLWSSLPFVASHPPTIEVFNMLLFRVLPAILGLADCAYALIPKPPNYEGENYNYDLTYQPPLKILEEPQYRDDSEKTDAIAEAFRHSWRGYYTYAFPKDTLNPLSGTFENDL